MKKFYLLLTLMIFMLNTQAQDLPPTSVALKGTCLNPDEGTIDFLFDLNINCPEADPNGILPGVEQMGFHSGANDWASIIAWDDPGTPALDNNGNDSFAISINVMDYYGVAFEDLTDVQMVINNGFATPDDPWTIAFRDSLDGENFGEPDPCSNLRLIIADAPTCADLAQSSSLSLFSDAGDSETCVDAADGLIKIDIDYDLACPEGDEGMVLAGESALGFHSGANDWAAPVDFDDPNAVSLVNDGNDNFSAIIDVQAYYGISYDDLNNIQMVANNGALNPDAAWDNAIKDPRDGGFGGTEPCTDLVFVKSEAPACDLMLGVQNPVLQHSFKVSPNPFRNRTFLEFNNPNQQTFDLVITNMAGQTLRTMTDISGERVLITRGDLATGLYIATLVDEAGHFATTKLAIK